MKQPTSKHSGSTTSDNERTMETRRPARSVSNPLPAATGRAQEGASGSALGLCHPALTPMPAALRGPATKGNPLGLRHPAITPMPAELRADDLWRVLAP